MSLCNMHLEERCKALLDGTGRLGEKSNFALDTYSNRSTNACEYIC
jgi:hypothetical protein